MFDRIFRKTFLSSDWRQAQPLSIDVDADRGALCGVRLGGSIESLSLLGPADDPKRAGEGVLR